MDVRVKNTGDSKKYMHDLNHVVSTTGTFGFMQPIVCRELAPQDTVTFQLGQKVYLNPLVKPTFGAINLKNYSYFVPISDIYHAFDSMMTSQSYYGSGQSYIPKVVPGVQPLFLYSYLRTFSKLRVYTSDNLHFTSNGWSFGFPLPIGSQPVEQMVTQCAWTQALQNGFWDSLGYSFSTAAFRSYRSIGKPYFESPVNSSLMPQDTLVSAASVYDSYDFCICMNVDNKNYLVCGTFSVRARNLRKMLLGAGFQLNLGSSEKTVVPLFAIYKAYFDLFLPSRDKTWKDTFAHHFMEVIEQNNLAPFSVWGANDDYIKMFTDFLYYELSECYYTQNPDFVSAHITGQSLPISSHDDEVATLNVSGENTLHVTSSPGGTSRLTSNNVANISWPALEILRRLYHRLNNTRVIGGRVKELLRSLNASEARDEKESFYLGSSSVDCSIDFVTSTAETSEGYLAELAGRGIGSYDGADDVIKYTASCFGYFITLSTFVPACGYAQAVEPCLSHLSKYDYFQKDFDSQTLCPTAKENIFGVQEIDVPDAVDAYSAGFGNKPLYLEYKFAYNKINGDMSLGSKRNTYLPFTLDKLLPFQASIYAGRANVNPDVLVNGTQWRYIGRHSFFGWFDRIFRNSGGSWNVAPLDNEIDLEFFDDNFVFFNKIDLKVLGFELPTSDSFQTDSYGSEFKVNLA